MGDSEMNRRDFIKVTTGIVGGLIAATVGLPAIAYLLDPALAEDGQAVAHRQRLLLVVRHVDEGDPDLAL